MHDATPVAAFQPLAGAGRLDRRAPLASLPQFRALSERGRDGATRLSDAFTPTQPRTLGPFFIGREAYLHRLIGAVEDERAHIVLYGERGRGKTSLANAFALRAAEAGYEVLRRSCSASIRFDELFRSLLADLPSHMAPPGRPLLPDGASDPGQIAQALLRIRNGHVVLLIDEFDRVQSTEVRIHLAEMIKNLSDAGAPVTFFIVGVADNIDDLLGRHPSIQRNVVGVYLSPMADVEIRQMIATGAESAGMRFAEPVIAAVIRFARGMPYYVHLLCLFAGRAAHARGSTEVATVDLRRAVDEVLTMQKPEFAARYDALLVGGDHEDILYAAANCATDPHGRFGPEALCGATLPDMPKLSAAAAAAGLEAMAALGEDSAVQRIETGDGPRFAFRASTMAHFILFRQAERRGLLGEALASDAA